MSLVCHCDDMNIYLECCSYCGDARECRDHIVPSSYHSLRKTFRTSMCVSSCHQCNTILSDLVFNGIMARASFLLSKYQKMLKLDKTADWGSEEINELDYSLRTLVLRRSFKRRLMKEKILNLERTSMGLHPYPIQWNENEIQTYKIDLSELWERILEKEAVGKVLFQEVQDEVELQSSGCGKKYAKRPCVECGDEFEPYHNRLMVCSPYCRRERNRRHIMNSLLRKDSASS